MAASIARIAAGQGASTSCRVATGPRPCGPAPRSKVLIRSTAPGFEKSMFGEDFGARDPTAGELGSNFGEKVLGNWNTEHIIKPPDAMGSVIGLKARACTPVEAAQLLEQLLVERYRQQVPGWRVVNNAAGIPCIRQEWTARDAAAAEQLLQQFRDAASAKGHDISHAEAVSSTAVVELTTAAKGGLTENDFIIAACINDMSVADLLAKKKARFWA